MSWRNYYFPRQPKKYKLPKTTPGYHYRRALDLGEHDHRVEMLMVAAAAKSHDEALEQIHTGKENHQIIKERRAIRRWHNASFSSAWRRFRRALLGN